MKNDIDWTRVHEPSINLNASQDPRLRHSNNFVAIVSPRPIEFERFPFVPADDANIDKVDSDRP